MGTLKYKSSYNHLSKPLFSKSSINLTQTYQILSPADSRNHLIEAVCPRYPCSEFGLRGSVNWTKNRNCHTIKTDCQHIRRRFVVELASIQQFTRPQATYLCPICPKMRNIIHPRKMNIYEKFEVSTTVHSGPKHHGQKGGKALTR